MNYLIEEANFNDIADIISLEEICFVNDRMHRKQLRYFLTKAKSLILLVKKNKQLIGCAVIFFRKNSSIARIYSIAIHPDYQGKKIGYTLLQSIEARLLQQNICEIRLEVRTDNAKALRFYQQNAYEIFGGYQQFYEDKRDALRLKKIIKPREIGIS